MNCHQNSLRGKLTEVRPDQQEGLLRKERQDIPRETKDLKYSKKRTTKISLVTNILHRLVWLRLSPRLSLVAPDWTLIYLDPINPGYTIFIILTKMKWYVSLVWAHLISIFTLSICISKIFYCLLIEVLEFYFHKGVVLCFSWSVFKF